MNSLSTTPLQEISLVIITWTQSSQKKKEAGTSPSPSSSSSHPILSPSKKHTTKPSPLPLGSPPSHPESQRNLNAKIPMPQPILMRDRVISLDRREYFTQDSSFDEEDPDDYDFSNSTYEDESVSDGEGSYFSNSMASPKIASRQNLQSYGGHLLPPGRQLADNYNLYL